MFESHFITVARRDGAAQCPAIAVQSNQELS
jgi:hypothetical protein